MHEYLYILLTPSYGARSDTQNNEGQRFINLLAYWDYLFIVNLWASALLYIW